jgi:hypothetical protein
MKVLSPTDFAAQLTDQVIKSLNLLKATLQDPILSQEVTSDQHTRLQAAVKEITTLFNQVGE